MSARSRINALTRTVIIRMAMSRMALCVTGICIITLVPYSRVIHKAMKII